MKLKMIAAVVGTLVAANVYAAETYNVEAGFESRSQSVDDKTELSGVGVAGTYYFKDIVIDHAQPAFELDFLQKASGITARYFSGNLETSDLTKTSFSPLELSGNFYVDDFVFGLNNSTWDTRFPLKKDATKSIGIKSTTTGFSAGYFVLPSTVVSFVNSKNTGTYSPSAGVSAIKDEVVTSNGLTSHTVTSLGGSQWLVLDLTYAQIKREQDKSENNTEYGVKARYYPETKYYFEAGYLSNTGDYEYNKGNAMLVGAGYEITPRLGVYFTSTKFTGSVDAQKSSYTQNSITAGYRF